MDICSPREGECGGEFPERLILLLLEYLPLHNISMNPARANLPSSLNVLKLNSFSAELLKVDSSIFKIGRLHYSCNQRLDNFDN